MAVQTVDLKLAGMKAVVERQGLVRALGRRLEGVDRLLSGEASDHLGARVRGRLGLLGISRDSGPVAPREGERT